MSKRMSISLIIFIVIICGGIFFILFSPDRPDSQKILTHMEQVYGKKFQIIEEFTYISYTDGEPDVQQELKCPAVKLQDSENRDIRFIAYAYPLEGDTWLYRDNYSQKLLIYCMRQAGLEIGNKDTCDTSTSFASPRLVLPGTDETAQKLRNMVIQFNESYRYDDEYTDGCEHFEVEGCMSLYSILAGNIRDRWLDETGPFCYDTPIEKFQKFLNELEKGR